MKQFIYKTLIAVIAIVLVYELTIAKQIKEFTSQSEVLMTKEGRKDGVNKIREELKKAVKKERYLSKEDAKLINDFIIDKTNIGSIDVDPPYMVKIISRKENIWIRTEIDSSLPIENILQSSNQDNFSFVKRFEILVNPTSNIDIYWNGQIIPNIESTENPAKINLNGMNRTITIQHFVPQN